MADPVTQDSSLIDRPERYVSHALVEIRRFRIIPMMAKSAVLLDFSAHGFKLEFTSEVKCRPGDQFWLTVPLAPLGIGVPTKFGCRVESRWFDDSRNRMGGIFVELDNGQRQIVNDIIDALKERGLVI